MAWGRKKDDEDAIRKALKDERTKIPTYLHAALEHVIALSKAEV